MDYYTLMGHATMKLLVTIFIVIIFCGRSFASSTESSDLDRIIYGERIASDHSANQSLTKALHAFGTGKSQEAVAHLQKFKANDWNSSSNRMKKTYFELDYMITRNALLDSAEPSKALIDSFHDKYNTLSAHYLSSFVNPPESTGAFAVELSKYEQLECDHSKYLLSFAESNTALEVLKKYQAFRSKYKELLNERILVPVQDVSGRISRQQISYRQHYGFRSDKSIASMIVAAAQTYHAKSRTDASTKALIDAYNSYIDQFSSDSTAGVYLDLRMQLEGKMDLDALLAFYKTCEDKDRQYNGNMLGLSHLLIDAHRPKDALLLLTQIDENKIPGRRVAERFYALARSYEMVGDKRNAVKYYMLVSNMTDRYMGATFKIEELTGLADFDYLQLSDVDMKDASASESNLPKQDGNAPFEVGNNSPGIGQNVDDITDTSKVAELNQENNRNWHVYAIWLVFVLSGLVAAVLLLNRGRTTGQ